MTALHAYTLPDEIRAEMARLHGAGFALVPLGRGADGKAPLRAWAGAAMTLAQVLGPMHRRGLGVYGVRLDGLAVIDCDSDDPELVAAMEARFGSSPVHVKTPRGRHLYYRAGGAVPNLRGEHVPVDIKTGGRSYVVGPLSQRPDGGRYSPAKGVLGVDSLPVLRPSAAPQAQAAPMQEGARHVALVREAIAMVEQVTGPKELTARLAALRDDLCENPATMPDSELSDIAGWAWHRLLAGEIFQGRHSTFQVHRLALDALRGKPGGSDAIALYVLLTDQHGHAPGKRFALSHAAMKAAGLTDLSLRAFRAARGLLEAEGLLRMAGQYRPGSHPKTFALQRLRPGMAEAENVLAMPQANSRSQPKKAGGEGLELHLMCNSAQHRGATGEAGDPRTCPPSPASNR